VRPVTGEYDSVPDLIFDITGVHILLNKSRRINAFPDKTD
jgi:hypothetical protein